MYRRVFLLSVVIVLAGCQLMLPNLKDRQTSTYLQPQATRLDKVFPNKYQKRFQTDNAQVYILDNPLDAFVARAALIDNADSSLDIQYYIWRADVTGSLLMNKILQAAQRGVRVRILLDDNNTRGMDNVLSVLDSQPNIEIRLFNPFVLRKLRSLTYLTDFPRLNRRMHNKSLTADNHSSIIGGRNIGDAYFHANDSETTFADMDVLVNGKIVGDISGSFDEYWNSDSSYPFREIAKHINVKQGIVQLAEAAMSTQYQTYLYQLQHSSLQRAIKKGNVPFLMVQATLISDDPAKALDRKTKFDIGNSLNAALQTPQHEVYLVSPYFVPTKAGVKALSAMRKQGIEVTVFTNSLKATDVAAVHSGYARYRKPLLQEGIKLYEFKPNQALPKNKDKGLTGSAATSLHSKTFIVDKQRVFIGSLNLDPRSLRLNTEMGLVIASPLLANAMEEQLKKNVAQTAYRVDLDSEGKLQWYDSSTNIISYQEPDAKLWKRFWSRIMSVLPIERLL